MQVRSTIAAVARATAVAGVLMLSAPMAALAAEVAESPDAGALPGTAQRLEGDGTLDAITGTIADGEDQDLYAICLPGGKTFSATTTIGSEAGDTQLFLFDAQGRGIYANDDASSMSLRSTLPPGHARTPEAEGVYLLGVSAYNDDPLGPDGARIFPEAGDSRNVVGPVDPSAVHSDWTTSASGSGAYRITLTGAQLCEPQPTDVTPPAITLTTPADGAEYLLDSEVVVDFSCTDEEGGSGLASCAGDLEDGAAIDTSTVGERTFTVTAADAAGNSAQVTHSYRVVYPHSGPMPPLADGVNQRRAGSTMPYKFSLGGDRGPDPVVAVSSVECGSQAAEPARTTPVTYSDGVYQFNWKTERAWAGTCRELLVEIVDGSVHRATFQFA